MHSGRPICICRHQTSDLEYQTLSGMPKCKWDLIIHFLSSWQLFNKKTAVAAVRRIICSFLKLSSDLQPLFIICCGIGCVPAHCCSHSQDSQMLLLYSLWQFTSPQSCNCHFQRNTPHTHKPSKVLLILPKSPPFLIF